MDASERLQYLVYFGIGFGVIVATGVLSLRAPLFFQRFFGRFNPLFVVIIVVILGLILLWTMVARGWFAILQTWHWQWLAIPSSLAALFALVIILIDSTVVFPKEMNVLFPHSVLFYPIMGFVAEVVFHLVPLTILLFAITRLTGDASFDRIVWPCLLMVAVLEPIYQARGGFLGQTPMWVSSYVFLHIFLINLVGLTLFKRYDFVSMYTFRLLYYLFWHILWGYARLRLLF